MEVGDPTRVSSSHCHSVRFWLRSSVVGDVRTQLKRRRLCGVWGGTW
jgi:hypothetical protein